MAVDFDMLRKINELASTLKAQGIAPTMDEALRMAESMVGRNSSPEKQRPVSKVPTIHELAERKRRSSSDIRSDEPEIIGRKASIGSTLEGGSTSINDLIEQVRKSSERKQEPEIIGSSVSFEKNEEEAAREIVESQECIDESSENGEGAPIDKKDGDEESDIVEYSQPEEEFVESSVEITDASEEDVNKLHDENNDLDDVEVESSVDDQISSDSDENVLSQDLDLFSKKEIDDVDFENVQDSKEKDDFEDFDNFDDGESVDDRGSNKELDLESDEDPETQYGFVTSDENGLSQDVFEADEPEAIQKEESSLDEIDDKKEDESHTDINSSDVSLENDIPENIEDSDSGDADYSESYQAVQIEEVSEKYSDDSNKDLNANMPKVEIYEQEQEEAKSNPDYIEISPDVEEEVEIEEISDQLDGLGTEDSKLEGSDDEQTESSVKNYDKENYEEDILDDERPISELLADKHDDLDWEEPVIKESGSSQEVIAEIPKKNDINISAQDIIDSSHDIYKKSSDDDWGDSEKYYD